MCENFHTDKKLVETFKMKDRNWGYELVSGFFTVN